MGQNISAIILDALKKHKKVTVSEIVNKTGFSRAYANRFFQALKDEGKIEKCLILSFVLFACPGTDFIICCAKSKPC